MLTLEMFGSRKTSCSVENPSLELMFKVFGSMDEAEVRAFLESQFPNPYEMTSAFFGTINLLIQSYEVEMIGTMQGGIWQGKADYGKRKPRQTGDLVLSFDGTGGTKHITVSKQTRRSYGLDQELSPQPEIPSFNQAIGVNGDSVAGCDITVPVFKFTYTYYAPTAIVTDDYIKLIMEMTGKTNDTAWKMFRPCEVLFLGPTGQPRGFDDWEIAFHFVANSFVSGISIPITGEHLLDSSLDPIAVDGHDYLWVRFQDIVGGTLTNKTLMKRPVNAYVERVYDQAEFTTLGIG